MTVCPGCMKPIVTFDYGYRICPRCGATILVHDPRTGRPPRVASPSEVNRQRWVQLDDSGNPMGNDLVPYAPRPDDAPTILSFVRRVVEPPVASKSPEPASLLAAIVGVGAALAAQAGWVAADRLIPSPLAHQLGEHYDLDGSVFLWLLGAGGVLWLYASCVAAVVVLMRAYGRPFDPVRLTTAVAASLLHTVWGVLPGIGLPLAAFMWARHGGRRIRRALGYVPQLSFAMIAMYTLFAFEFVYIAWLGGVH